MFFTRQYLIYAHCATWSISIYSPPESPRRIKLLFHEEKNKEQNNTGTKYRRYSAYNITLNGRFDNVTIFFIV